MIDGLKPYPEYKESGLPWVGQMPRHWELKRGKSVFRCIDKRSANGKEELLTVSSERGVVPRRTAKVTMFKAESYSGYKMCWPGDLVINSLWAWGRGLGVSQYHGIISSAYGVYRLRPDVAASPAFIHEVVRSSPFNWELQVRSKGIWISRLQLTDESFLDAPFHLPPRDEQAAIVRFLDHANGRIERAIRAKQKLMALLHEQKQAIIHRAVTRGLNPNVPLKPSGIPWLGDIPQHWEVRRLRHLIQGRLTYGANEAADHDNKDWPRYLRITDFRSDGSLRPDTFRSLPPDVAKDYLVQPGDILLARSGATVGKAFLVKADAEEACHAGYLIRARPDTKFVTPEFLFAFTQSAGFREWKDCTFNTATIQNIGADKYANLTVPLPPTSEQLEILKFVGVQTKPINDAILRSEREIGLLREYRTRLVADVVTGKLDVRAAARQLPEEGGKLSDGADQSDGLDESDLSGETPLE